MKKILVIRQFDDFSRILTENGFEIINLPLIEAKPLEDLTDFEAKLKSIENYDGIFLTSQNAARILAEKFDELEINYSGKVYVLGRRSFQILQNRNLDLMFFKDANSADEMLGKIPINDLRDKNFLFVRGEKSLETIPNFVRNFAAIAEVTVYTNQAIFPEFSRIAEIKDSFGASQIEVVCFFSPSAGEIFNVKFNAEILHQTKIAAIGKTTADFFERQNLKVDFVSPKSNAEDFAVNLIKYITDK